ncbi:MAG: Gfo/Idh/MocA family oxidoreductase [Planctomycetota bacterium]
MAQTPDPGHPLRFGVLATGSIARAVAPAIHAAEGCEVVCFASRSRDRAVACAREMGLSSPIAACTYEELVELDAVDAVYLANMNDGHPEWSIRLLRAGKHVLCEKPMAWTAADARAMLDAADESGRVLVEAFMMLHSTVIRDAVALAQDPSGPIGRLKRIEAAFEVSIATEPPARSTRFSRELVGGAILDLGCYPLCLGRAITGEEPEIRSAEGEFVDWYQPEGVGRVGDGPVDGSARVEAVFPSGVELSFSCSMTAPRRIHARLIGDKAAIEVPGFQNPARYDIASLDDLDEHRPGLERDWIPESYTEQAASFGRACRGEGGPWPSREFMLGQAEAIEAVYEKMGFELPVARGVG